MYKLQSIAWLIIIDTAQNSREPKIEPCETPREIFANFDYYIKCLL